MSIKKLYELIAIGFGSGRSPLAPGTAGAAVALILFYGMHQIWPAWPIHALVLVIILGVGTFSIHQINRGDAKDIVIDEWLGIGMATLGCSFSWPEMLVAFVGFRFFDIAKPLGIRWIDRQKNWGAWGVMLDDVLAGVYAWFLVFAFRRFYELGVL